jgi:hypothetical protein
MISLLGTWKLLRVRATDAAGQPLEHHQYGPEPTGIVQFGPQRMQAATGDGRAVLPPGVKRFWSGYTGNYTFDGQVLVTRVDEASGTHGGWCDAAVGIVLGEDWLKRALHAVTRKLAGGV